ncbi:MAG: hypothetical protein ACOYNY_34985 [Caldilineaceae bacterium]|jgi:hypothetical protein
MSTTTIVLLVTLLAGLVFTWQCWRDLDAIRQELQRIERERTIKARVLAEVAKLRMEVQP